MEFFVTMIKEYEASVLVEADSAEQACDMIADGDFSKVVEGSYEADLSEEFITDVKVYEDPDDDPAAEWNFTDRR